MSRLLLPNPIEPPSGRLESPAGPVPRLWPDLTPAHQQQLAQRLAELLQRALKSPPPKEVADEPPRGSLEQ